MALIRVHDSLLCDPDTFELLMSAFDTAEIIRNERSVTVFRVSHEEVPKDDKVICPLVYRFEGVRPFVIEWDT